VPMLKTDAASTCASIYVIIVETSSCEPPRVGRPWRWNFAGSEQIVDLANLLHGIVLRRYRRVPVLHHFGVHKVARNYWGFAKLGNTWGHSRLNSVN
jgi:hypothetical protein